MNLLLIEKKQIREDGSFEVDREHAEHLRSVLRVKEGDSVKVGILNGKIGEAVVISLARNSATLKINELNLLPPDPVPITLIVALPRPQSMKKVLHFAVSYGIKNLYFIGTERVEKSYWNSSDMQPDALRREILLGLEQGVDTVFPNIYLRPKLHEFLNNGELRSLALSHDHALIAHPNIGKSYSLGHSDGSFVLLIGPEGGFLPREVERFMECGFSGVNLGNHILRVEFAVSFLCGCISGIVNSKTQ